MYLSKDSSFLLFFKNLLSPKRFLTKLSYGQIVNLPISLLAPKLSFETGNKKRNEDLAKELKRDSYFIYPELFPDIADYILDKYKDFLEPLKPEGNYRTLLINKDDPELFNFILNENFLEIIQNYFKGKPYLRSASNLNVTYPNKDHLWTKDIYVKEENFNIGWHYDTVNMVQFSLILNDLTESDTHMEIAKGQSKTHRINLGINDYYYSDEYIYNNYKVVGSLGKKGTVVFFDSNTPHRLKMAKDSLRLDLKVMFTPGNNNLNLDHPEKGYRLEVTEQTLSQLSDNQKSSLELLLK